MKTSTFLLAPFFLTTGVLAQSSADVTVSGVSCDGDEFVSNSEGYCCVNGEFSGPVIASFSSNLASGSVSQSSFQSSLRASLSSEFSNSGINTGAAAQITAAAKLKRGGLVGRAITTEVSSGLTCIGDSASSFDAGAGGVTLSSSDSMTTDTGSTATSASAAMTSSSSTGGMPMMTPGPVVALGAAAAAFAAYGAM